MKTTIEYGRARRLAAVFGTALVICGALPALASAAHLTSHGQLLHLRANTNTSTNWFGYQQGALEQGGKLFNSVSGDWIVPTASSHSGQDGASSNWVGIGGGCIDANCTLTDPTLIQTGTEQDVTAAGQTSYSAWWELVPAPSLTISSMTVSPGDHMHASVAEVVPDSNLWVISIKDVTRNESFSQTVPYASTHGTAEWIEETPLLIGTNAGFAALPNLTNPLFDLGTVNGAAPKLTSSEQMDLTDANGNVIGTPSSPDPDLDGFSACTWATSCAAPGSS
jgi:hypothetical protein